MAVHASGWPAVVSAMPDDLHYEGEWSGVGWLTATVGGRTVRLALTPPRRAYLLAMLAEHAEAVDDDGPIELAE